MLAAYLLKMTRQAWFFDGYLWSSPESTWRIAAPDNASDRGVIAGTLIGVALAIFLQIYPLWSS